MLPTQEHDAFCLACPTPAQVTDCLNELGLRLVFQMEAVCYPAYAPTPDLPAQYHYKDEQRVMYNQKSTPFDSFGKTASRAECAV